MIVYSAVFAAAGFWCGLISGLILTGEQGLREFETECQGKYLDPRRMK